MILPTLPLALAGCLEAPQVWDECDLDGTIFCVNEISGMLDDEDNTCYNADARYSWPSDSTCHCVEGTCASDVSTSG